MTEQNQQHDADTRLATRSRAVFDDAVANLDGATRSRLNRARQAALQAAASVPTRGTARWLLPVGSVAALLLVTVGSLHLWQLSTAPTSTSAHLASNAVDDFEIMTSDADLDMLKDMEFYAWLDTQDLQAIDPLTAAMGDREQG